MKLFAKLMLAVLVLAMALPFTVLKDDSGKPLLSFGNLKMPDFSMPDFGKVDQLTPDLDVGGGKDLIYEWYDAAGNRNFSSEPPPEGVEYTVRGYDPDANVIQAVKLPEESGDEDKDREASAKPIKKPGDGVNPYSPEAVEKLFEDAKNIEKLLDERLKQQEQAINQ